MIYISVDNGGGEICREVVHASESIFAAIQRMFHDGYEPYAGDTIRIIDDEEDES